MTPIQIIRSRLDLSQQQLASAIGVTQALVSYVERGAYRTSPTLAGRIVTLARSRGLMIGFDHLYGCATIPRCGAQAESTIDATSGVLNG